MSTVEDLFAHLFTQGPSEKTKKGQSWILKENLTKISDYDFFIWVIFLYKEEKYSGDRLFWVKSSILSIWQVWIYTYKVALHICTQSLKLVLVDGSMFKANI